MTVLRSEKVSLIQVNRADIPCFSFMPRFIGMMKKKGPTTRLMVEPFSESTLNQKKPSLWFGDFVLSSSYSCRHSLT